jgi:hypothetical protein
VLVTALGVVMASSLPALAAGFDPDEMVFPVDGENSYSDTFGAPRGGGRTHEGTDILADKGVPVLAVAEGSVRWIGTTCCYLALDHGDGWETWYIHLNNDTQNLDGSYSDDGLGWGIADGIEVGVEVSAGQVIGWVGDSGNAEWTGSHLHFELRRDGVAINAYEYLVKAEGNWTGYFRDDDFSVHENNIDKIFEAGITVGCNPPLNDEYCPQRNITRGEMAAFIARALRLSEMSGEPAFDDLEGHLFENAVDKIVTAGIGFGCTKSSFCPDQPLLRDEMAELLVRAFGYENPDQTDFFIDDDGNQFEDSINRLAYARITVGCNPPGNDRFCPDRELSRAEMATFFVRALGL